jgi:hypothetical protein
MSHDNPPADHVQIDEESNDVPIQEHLKSKPTWLRLVFMLVFYVLGSLAAMIASVVMLLGFCWVLFTGETNDQLKRVGRSMAAYFYQIVCYLTYNSDVQPFPFEGEWPSADLDTSVDD